MTSAQVDAEKHKEEISVVETAIDKGADDTSVSSIDVAQFDEALKIVEDHIRSGGQESWTEQEEKALRRKVDWRLIPVICLSYGLQAYDKAMLSQAVSYGHHLGIPFSIRVRAIVG